jgi:hypothetical protein
MRRAAFASVLAGLLPCWVAHAAATCDRVCLKDTLDRYVEAVVAHDPSRLSVARDIEFTENLVPLKFGHEGLWATANGRRDFNIYALDPTRGDAVWIGILKENDKPVMTAIRLKIVDRRIAEAETLVGRVGLGAADTVAGPRPDFSQPIPGAEQSTREALIASANSNWNAMEQSNGDLAPYAQDCERYDNGRKTTNGPSPGHAANGGASNGADATATAAPPGADPAPNAPTGEPAATANAEIGNLGCYGQMNSGRFKNGNKVYPRRIWAVDREYGLVVGLFTPNVPGTARTLHLRNGQTLTVGPDELIPFTIEQVEMFRIVRGQISRVEVVLGPRVPYGTRSPFDMKSLWEPR